MTAEGWAGALVDPIGVAEAARDLMSPPVRANLDYRGLDGMAQFTEAVYTNGVLRPEGELVLREAQRVRPIVEAFDDDTDRVERSAAIERLVAGIGRMRFFSRERLPSRDELHDRP